MFLPQLALDDALRHTPDPSAPIALVHGPRQRRILHSVNPSARALGLRPGMTLAATQALGINYHSVDFDPVVTQRARELLAAWAYGYSSQVSLDLTHAIVMEVGRSHRLFGTWGQLQPRLRRQLSDMGYRHRIVLAPNPWAARALATVHDSLAADEASLQTHLGDLPIKCAGFPSETCKALAGIGMRRLRDLWAMPRASLARRFSMEIVKHVDRLRGDAPCTLTWYQPPDQFDSRIEFAYDVDSSQALLFPLRRLTADLAAFLYGRDGGVQRFSLWLEHEGKTHSEITVGLLTPERKASVLFDLARNYLEKATVPAPVRGLRLHAADLPCFIPDSGDLFNTRAKQDVTWLQVQERLRSRIGQAAVCTPNHSADHRPECALRPGSSLATSNQIKGRRPGWLLPAPVLLNGQTIAVIAGPERIESGWWEDDDVRRDYYVTGSATGQQAWVFQDLRENSGPFLHGLFG